MRSNWRYNCCFLNVRLPGFFQNSSGLLVYFSSSFSPCFSLGPVVKPYSSTDMATAWENSCFIFSERSAFCMIDNPSAAVEAFFMKMLTTLSDKTRLFFFVFPKKPVLSITCSKLFSRDSAGAGVFARIGRSFTLRLLWFLRNIVWHTHTYIYIYKNKKSNNLNIS